MRRLLEFALLGMACCVARPAAAQDSGVQAADSGTPVPASAQDRPRVVPAENVKIDYAQVLRVEPVYQTLHAIRTEVHCEPLPPPDAPAEAKDEAGLFRRMFNSIKGLLSREDDEPVAAPEPAPAKDNSCRIVRVGREFQRPIAYDVDYVYKGTKYRSRLAEDPGNRMRIRVSVTPWEGEAAVMATP